MYVSVEVTSVSGPSPVCEGRSSQGYLRQTVHMDRPQDQLLPLQQGEQLAAVWPVLTLSLPDKLSSAQFLVCLNFLSASMLLKIGENVVRVSNSLDSDETPSHSASHPDSSCLHMAL